MCPGRAIELGAIAQGEALLTSKDCAERRQSQGKSRVTARPRELSKGVVPPAGFGKPWPSSTGCGPSLAPCARIGLRGSTTQPPFSP
eukprot:2544652-Pyramimonas_sp.AAC.1